MPRGELSGTRIVVAGAGLAGLAAALDLQTAGADVVVLEARDRVGGRVHTIRAGFADGQHAEGGADLIEGEQSFTRALARAAGLEPIRILRRGFGFYGPDRTGRRRIRAGPRGLKEAAALLAREIADFELAGRRWDSAIARRLARRSVADWLRAIQAPPDVVAGLRAMRGFFLADPEDLSLLPLVEQLAEWGTPGEGEMFRLPDGNDRLPQAVARRLRRPVQLQTILRRVTTTTDGVIAAAERRSMLEEVRADYCVLALPATTLKDVRFEPRLHDRQHRAISTLRFGSATRVLLQFASPFWRRRLRPRAFGTDLPTGAVWDASEGQRGRQAILSLLAGGRAAREVREIISSEGLEGVVDRLRWLGAPARLVASAVIRWDDDPWSRGGYAYFDPSFDPELRAWLARRSGRLVFAGEHTSIEWQGYMNGAVESGRRAAAEIRALHAGG